MQKFLFSLRFYLFERKSTHAGARQHEQRKGEAEGEADSPLSRQPDMGLNPRTLGS